MIANLILYLWSTYFWVKEFSKVSGGDNILQFEHIVTSLIWRVILCITWLPRFDFFQDNCKCGTVFSVTILLQLFFSFLSNLLNSCSCTFELHKLHVGNYFLAASTVNFQFWSIILYIRINMPLGAISAQQWRKLHLGRLPLYFQSLELFYLLLAPLRANLQKNGRHHVQNFEFLEQLSFNIYIYIYICQRLDKNRRMVPSILQLKFKTNIKEGQDMRKNVVYFKLL